MDDTYPEGFIPIGDAFTRACATSEECLKLARSVVGVSVDPAKFVPIGTWKAATPGNLVVDDPAAFNSVGRGAAEWPTPETIAAFSPTDEYDAAELKVWLLMGKAIVDGQLPCFVEKNGQVRPFDIDPRDYGEEAFIPGAGVNNFDRDGRRVLLELDVFEAWRLATFAIQGQPDKQVTNSGDDQGFAPAEQKPSIEPAEQQPQSNFGWIKRADRADLSTGQCAVFEVVKLLFPNGIKGCRAMERDERIQKALKPSGYSDYGPSTIKRTFQKISFVDPK